MIILSCCTRVFNPSLRYGTWCAAVARSWPNGSRRREGRLLPKGCCWRNSFDHERKRFNLVRDGDCGNQRGKGCAVNANIWPKPFLVLPLFIHTEGSPVTERGNRARAELSDSSMLLHSMLFQSLLPPASDGGGLGAVRVSVAKRHQCPFYSLPLPETSRFCPSVDELRSVL